MVSLEEPRGLRSGSGGGSGLGEIWMTSEGQRERTGTGLISVTLLLVWPTPDPKECEGNRVGRNVRRINKGTNGLCGGKSLS